MDDDTDDGAKPKHILPPTDVLKAMLDGSYKSSSPTLIELSANTPSPYEFEKKTKKERRSARAFHHYKDHHEDYVLMTRSRLREIADFGILREGAGAAGVFFASGAFWLLITIIVEHSDNLVGYAPWIGMCVLSILFGGTLIWVAWVNYSRMKGVIEAAFQEDDVDEFTSPQ